MPTEKESLIDITQSDTLDTPMKTPSEFMPNLSGQLTPTPVTSKKLPNVEDINKSLGRESFKSILDKIKEQQQAKKLRPITGTAGVTAGIVPQEKLPPLVEETALDKQVREEKEAAKSIVTQNQRDWENLQRRLSQPDLDNQMKAVAKGKGPVESIPTKPSPRREKLKTKTDMDYTVGSLESPGMPERPTGSSVLTALLSKLEGTAAHKDQRGIMTAAYGVVIDPRHKTAYDRNKKIADLFRYDINNLTNDQALVIAE